jgi:hypothetical protein
MVKSALLPGPFQKPFHNLFRIVAAMKIVMGEISEIFAFGSFSKTT